MERETFLSAMEEMTLSQSLISFATGVSRFRINQYVNDYVDLTELEQKKIKTFLLDNAKTQINAIQAIVMELKIV